jgi:hypothetical protein
MHTHPMNSANGTDASSHTTNADSTEDIDSSTSADTVSE